MLEKIGTTLKNATLIITAFTALPACERLTDPDDEDADLSGSVSYNYQVVAPDLSVSNGQVSISGEYKVVDGVIQGNAVAIGIGPRDIVAQHDKGATSNYFYLTLSDIVTGEYRASTDCNPQQQLCAFIEIGIDIPNEGDAADDFLPMLSGYVYITSVADGRLQGTFTGGAGAENGDLPHYTLNDGKFDVPVIDPRKVPGLKGSM